MIQKLCFILCLMVMYSSCHRHAPHVSIDPDGEAEAQVFVGLASYYSNKFSGKTTASGATYEPTGLTAAHRTLPLGSRVTVTNLDNDRSVIVIITDRGPQRPDRVIDLSFAAAQELDMLRAGIVKVRVEVLYDQ